LINKHLLDFKNSGLTSDAIGKHVDNYDFEEGLKQLSLDFVQGKHQGGLIYGNTGNGKTHLLCAIARELIFAGKKVRYVSHQQLLENIKKSFDKNSDVSDPRYSWLDGVQVVLFQVLFASNLTPRQMKQQFLDIRSISRISGMCQDFKFEMKGEDRRASDEFWK
jgi:DNA replication protein DnaC